MKNNLCADTCFCYHGTVQDTCWTSVTGQLRAPHGTTNEQVKVTVGVKVRTLVRVTTRECAVDEERLFVTLDSTTSSPGRSL